MKIEKIRKQGKERDTMSKPLTALATCPLLALAHPVHANGKFYPRRLQLADDAPDNLPTPRVPKKKSAKKSIFLK